MLEILSGKLEEMQARKEDLKFAIENNLVFAPAMHPWVTGLTDKEGLVIRRILEFGKQNEGTFFERVL